MMINLWIWATPFSWTAMLAGKFQSVLVLLLVVVGGKLAGGFHIFASPVLTCDCSRMILILFGDGWSRYQTWESVPQLDEWKIAEPLRSDGKQPMQPIFSANSEGQLQWKVMEKNLLQFSAAALQPQACRRRLTQTAANCEHDISEYGYYIFSCHHT